MNTKYVCGTDIEFDKKGNKYALDPVIVEDSVENVVRARYNLNPSWEYSIYEVDTNDTATLKITSGFLQGSKARGYRVIRKVCEAYKHPVWDECARSETPRRRKS